jgi:hypothetical protein
LVIYRLILKMQGLLKGLVEKEDVKRADVTYGGGKNLRDDLLEAGGKGQKAGGERNQNGVSDVNENGDGQKFENGPEAALGKRFATGKGGRAGKTFVDKHGLGKDKPDAKDQAGNDK